MLLLGLGIKEETEKKTLHRYGSLFQDTLPGSATLSMKNLGGREESSGLTWDLKQAPSESGHRAVLPYGHVTGEVRNALPPTALSTSFRDNWHLTACLLRAKLPSTKPQPLGPAESLFLRPKGESTVACWWAPDTCCVLGLQPQGSRHADSLTPHCWEPQLQDELGWTE